MTGVPWKQGDLDLLRSGIAEGLSGSAIARQIGVTRSAVMGQARRLGMRFVKQPGGHPGVLRSRVGKPAKPAKPKKPEQPECTKPVDMRPRKAARPPAKAFVGRTKACDDYFEPRFTSSDTSWKALPESAPAALVDLPRSACRWPLWHEQKPGEAGYGVYCGARALDGRAYCAGHGRMAFRQAGAA